MDFIELLNWVSLREGKFFLSVNLGENGLFT